MKKTALICLLVSIIIAAPAFSQEKAPSPAYINKTMDNKNILGTVYAENLIKKAEFSIKSNNYISAKQAIDSINEWVSDAAEYHADLFKTLKKIENSDVQANIERDLAIKFATMRDQILFLQAKIFIHDGQKRSAVENLVEVVKSQPNTELGFQSYKLLQEIGFTYGVETLPVKTEPIQP